MAKNLPSWKAIIIWFIFFWPVSVYLIWKRLSMDRAAAMHNSTVFKVVGIILVSMGFLMLTTIGDKDMGIGTVLFGFIFYTGGGVLLLWGSNKIKRAGEMYKNYINIVINQNQTKIKKIASITGLNYDETEKGLQKMINLGYFEGAYIDQANHEIVLPKKQQMLVSEQMQGSNSNSELKQRVVKCPNCCGNNIITIGEICECDFCGSPIE